MARLPYSHLLASLAAAVALYGCGGLGGANLADHDYRLRFPVTVDERLAVLDLKSLETDGDRLTTFANDFLKRGMGRVGVLVTGESETDESAITLAHEIGVALMRRGLAERDFELRLLAEPTAEQRRAVLHFAFHVAKVPECGEWKAHFTADYSNAPTYNFGCATQRNVGLMAANPRDLIEPREGRGRDGARAIDIVDKYRRGVAIAGAREVTTAPVTTGGTGGK
jgi:pilus assembly protein CpaD